MRFVPLLALMLACGETTPTVGGSCDSILTACQNPTDPAAEECQTLGEEADEAACEPRVQECIDTCQQPVG